MNQAAQGSVFAPDAAEYRTDTPDRTNVQQISISDPIRTNEGTHHTADTETHRPSQQYEPIQEGDDVMLRDLARTHSKQGHKLGSTLTSSRSSDTNTTNNNPEDNSELDPTSGNFDLHKYLRRTLAVLEMESMVLKEADVVMKNVNVSGSGKALNFQDTVSGMLMTPFRLRESLSNTEPKHILRNCNAILKHGELLVVLGRPGAGCSTFLKAMTGETHNLKYAKNSSIHYSGIAQKTMTKEFKGEVVYNQEVDKHFPHLTVG
ncbi:pleiotropic drug resistance protein, ABC superfamily, partial [Aureobasidium melanogenum]